MRSANVAAMLIGIVGVVFGIYSMVQGQTLEKSGYTLFIGLTLFGVAFINYRLLKKKESQ